MTHDGAAIPDILEKHCRNGHSYMRSDAVRCRYLAEHPESGRKGFAAELEMLTEAGRLVLEGDTVYLKEIWEDETLTAQNLAKRLRKTPRDEEPLPETVRSGNIVLDGEQRAAVLKAIENDLTLILGGAGSGKSATACALVDVLGIDPDRELVLCAPTGKAARNLCEATGYPAGTLHKALHMYCGGKAQGQNALAGKKLIVVDEAGMMPLHVFSELLKAAPDDCRIVLVGDRNQLQGIGTGNVLADLLELGVPCQELRTLHRQRDGTSALYHNVACFPEIASVSELLKDESFQIRTGTEDELWMLLVDEAVRRYQAGESVCVITPRRRGVRLGAEELSLLIREKLNPPRDGVRALPYGEIQLRDGDRVMVNVNDAARSCFNGDVGVLRLRGAEDHPRCDVSIQNGSRASWSAEELSSRLPLELAYAMSVHKAQGSGYDTVLIPLSEEQMGNMLNRNLFYTAISRAKERVILLSTEEAIERALQTRPLPRNSNLAAKTRKYLAGR